jgi:hypothetical protein
MSTRRSLPAPWGCPASHPLQDLVRTEAYPIHGFVCQWCRAAVEPSATTTGTSLVNLANTPTWRSSPQRYGSRARDGVSVRCRSAATCSARRITRRMLPPSNCRTSSSPYPRRSSSTMSAG